MPVAVAIDFGTSRTGYAYAFFGDAKREVYFRHEWPNQPVPFPKNLSNLLYDPDGRLVAWGFAAMHELARLRNDPRRQEYRHLTGYKMRLKDGQPGPKGPTFDQDGTSFCAVHVIGDILAEIRKMVITDLSRAGSGTFNESEILWCLTVPAIWTDGDKQVMEKSAVRAGLVTNDPRDIDRRLLFALEPEAAALYCQEKDSERLGSQLTPDTVFMIVDAGGGTVDLTVHKVTEKGRGNVVAGSGGKCGSTYVDGEFMQFLSDLLGVELLDRIAEEEPAEFLELLRHWEREKCQFDGNATQDVLIPLSRRVGRLIDDSPVALHRLQQVQGGDDENIHLSPKKMEQLFHPVLEDIRRTVAEQFEDLGGEERCDYLFLVGGFAGSPALNRMIRAHFEGRVKKVIVPPEPGKAVVMGAALFALDQERIGARPSRLTYGCRILEPFKQGVDPEERKVHDANRQTDRCHVFDVFVRAGELLRTDYVVKRTYHPLREDQTSVRLVILGTESPLVRYPDEPGVSELARLQFKIPDARAGTRREIEVTMYFGLTKVRVRVIDKATNEEVHPDVDFS